ncbi:MAG: EVE domain-containing protein [Chitinophagaceae bacterium]|nr:MAG: EVE domain-containing protein [Chitinophagaceae bacterium]
MNYWLVKSEPGTYSWDDLVKDKKTFWDGVRNYQARNNLKEMKKGDMVLFYHSVKEKQVVGVSEVVKEAYQDPTTKDDRWVAVDIKAKEKLKNPVSLEMVKKDERLDEIALVRQSRLSVMPLKAEEFDVILELSR